MINFSLIICLTTLVSKESCPEFPDVTLKVRVNLDTPISQIMKNLTLPLLKQAHRMLSYFTFEK